MATNLNTTKQAYGKEFSIGITTNDNTRWLNNADVIECYFIEDLYAYMRTGKLTFIDKNGIMEFGSLVIGSTVDILFGEGTYDGSVGKDDTVVTLEIYKAQNITQSSPNVDGKQNVIELILVEPQFQNLTNQKYSRSWNQKKITTIMSDILEKMVGFDIDYITITDESDEIIDFTMPYWTPLQALNWLCNKSSSDGKWGFCCYMRRDYDYNDIGKAIEIQTLESMFQSKDIIEDTNSGIYTLSSPLLYDYNKILSYEMSGVDLTSNKQIRGGHLTGYDFKRKKFLENIYQYSEGQDDIGESIVDNFTMLGDWTLFKGTEYSTLKDADVDIQMIGDDDENIIKNVYFNNWVKRYSVQNMINIIVRGHESREVGKMITIKWPSIDEEKESYNSNLNGKYLIKSVTHFFEPNGKPSFKQKLGLMKNAYNYDEMDEKILLPSIKKNKSTENNKIIQ